MNFYKNKTLLNFTLFFFNILIVFRVYGNWIHMVKYCKTVKRERERGRDGRRKGGRKKGRHPIDRQTDRQMDGWMHR